MDTDELRKKAIELALGTKDIADEVKRLAEPVDIDKLIQDGLITKQGAWYLVHDMESLPYAFKGLIKEMAQTENGVKVKLHNKSQFEKLAKKFEKMGY